MSGRRKAGPPRPWSSSEPLSLGEALLGLRVIRYDTGGGPTLWPLVKQWLFGFAVVFGLFG